MRLLRFLPRFQKAYRAIETLQQRESWSRSQIEAFQLERVNALWQHAIAHVPYYRNLANDQRLPARFGSLAEFRALVPVLPKAAVRTTRAAFLSERAQRGRWHATSGSTGVPMRFFWAHTAHQEMLQAVYRFHAAWGLNLFDPLVFFWGPEPQPPSRLHAAFTTLRQRIGDRLRNRLRLSAHYLAPEDLRDHLRRIAHFAPCGLYGLSKAVHLLALEAETAHFVCPSLKLVILTGEPAPTRILETVERVFQAPAVIEYGSVECGFLAGQATDRTLRVREDRALLETLPRPDGRFDIVVTVLDNPSFPLIRYAIEDVTDQPLRSTEQGFAILHNVGGRDCDLLVSRSGRYLHSVLVDSLFEGPVGETIRRYRVRQHRDGALLVEIEPQSASSRVDTHRIQTHLQEMVEGFPVEVAVVRCLAVTPSGKQRVVSSDRVNL